MLADEIEQFIQPVNDSAFRDTGAVGNLSFDLGDRMERPGAKRVTSITLHAFMVFSIRR